MPPALFALSALLLASGPAKANLTPVEWEKVFEVRGGRDIWISSVRAVSREEWFVGGSWGVARATKGGGIEKRDLPGRKVIGMVVEGPGSVFAFGNDELVLHFDAKGWTEEHYVPRQGKRASRGKDLVYVGFIPSGAPDAPIVAVGPTLVLVRKPDNTWQVPSEAERVRLETLGQHGPDFQRPAKCDPGGWRWLGKEWGAFFCQDGRSFIYEKGVISPKGQVPKPCRSALGGVASSQGELYATCGAGRLWKTEAEGWTLLSTFANTTELTDVSVADGCIFVAARQSVWRRCRL